MKADVAFKNYLAGTESAHDLIDAIKQLDLDD